MLPLDMALSPCLYPSAVWTTESDWFMTEARCASVIVRVDGVDANMCVSLEQERLLAITENWSAQSDERPEQTEASSPVSVHPLS